MDRFAEKVFQTLYARGLDGVVTADRLYREAINLISNNRGLTTAAAVANQEIAGAAHVVAAANAYLGELSTQERMALGFPVPTTGDPPVESEPLDGWPTWTIGPTTDFHGFAGLLQKWGPAEIIFLRPEDWPEEASALVVGLREAPYHQGVFDVARQVKL